MRVLILVMAVFAMTRHLDGAEDYESRRGSRVSWARGKYHVHNNSSYIANNDWYMYPSADLKFLEQLIDNTSINMSLEWNVASFKKLDDMCAFPLIFLSSEHFVNMHDDENANLKEYLLRGGMIWLDDCVWKGQNLFYRSMLEKLKKIFPDVVFKSYKRDYPLLTCYYKFDGWLHLQGIDTGITLAYLDGRLIGMLSGSDLHCGWVGAGWFRPFPAKRDAAYRMGINIYVYGMTN